jgi:hypothetical protein
MRRYEHDLKVPYYLLFVPGEEQELTLYRHTGERYVSVIPDQNGRYGIAELDLAVGLLDGWVRYWFQGELLPLPANLLFALEDTQRQLAEMTHRANAQERRADTEKEARLALEQELAQLRAQMKEQS